jgi:hypothetical protein
MERIFGSQVPLRAVLALAALLKGRVELPWVLGSKITALQGSGMSGHGASPRCCTAKESAHNRVLEKAVPNGKPYTKQVARFARGPSAAWLDRENVRDIARVISSFPCSVGPHSESCRSYCTRDQRVGAPALLLQGAQGPPH